MPFSSSNTGSTDLRLTEVQQPNTAATFSFCRSSRAFSANSGQFDAGSTTTASSLRPSRPPFLFCSSIIISTVSFSVVSLMAMVPESECRIPTLIVGCCAPTNEYASGAAKRHTAASHTCLRVISKYSLGERRRRLHLDLEADADGLGVLPDRRERGVAEEEHHPGVVLLDDVVDVDLGRVLVVVVGHAVLEARLGELAEHLKLAGLLAHLREQVGGQHVGAVAVG